MFPSHDQVQSITTDFVPLNSNDSYIIRLNKSNNITEIEQIALYDESKTYIETYSIHKSDNSVFQFKTPNNAVYARVCFKNTDSTALSLTALQNILPKLENGNIATDYSSTQDQLAIFGVLTNESQSIPTDSNGENGNFAGAITSLDIYIGSTDTTNEWNIMAVPSNGIVGSLAGNTFTVTDMTICSLISCCAY